MKQISILTFIFIFMIYGCDNKNNLTENKEGSMFLEDTAVSYIHPELKRSLDSLIAFETEKANPFFSGFDFINCIFSGDTLKMYGAPYCLDDKHRTIISYKEKSVFIYSDPQFDWRYYCDPMEKEDKKIRKKYTKKQYLNDVPNVDLDLEMLKFEITEKDSFELVWQGLY